MSGFGRKTDYFLDWCRGLRTTLAGHWVVGHLYDEVTDPAPV